MLAFHITSLMTDQFYDPRVFIKRSDPKAVPTGGSGGVRRPPDSAARKMAEIENNTETFDVSHTGVDMANRIKSLRAAKEMSQKDLAQRANVKIDIVRDYENGRAIPNSKIISKFEQILGGPIRETKNSTQKKRK